ncbi:MAG: NADH-quinone oxidoreductase subunit A [bacterium]|jgi:NADH-quinone oxidoreductase subunit A|nr:NADH-quinone oxidoreductase subunit A [Planctomycetota bacterium]HIL52813.1 NADH-quinone oxidoreductase subunit A [Planctomycetota bacterium]
MPTPYTALFILLGIVVGFVVLVTVASNLLGRKRQNAEKDSPYECGMDSESPARVRISIHFYLVAVLFILFDVEALFLILWAGSAEAFNAAGHGALVFAEVSAFVAVLALALAYVWRKGGLEWDR